MRIIPLCAATCISISCAAPGAAAQGQGNATTVVEILGLRSWTAQMVEDSVAKYAPGVSLQDHACAVILRDSVGFADAASIGFSRSDTTWSILPVVEPGMKERVRFRAYSVKRPPVEEWAGVFAILNADPRAMSPLQHPEVLLEGPDAVFGRVLSDATVELRRAVRARDAPQDWELARSTILTDSSYSNRAVAALVLSNFADRDSAFYLLAEGLRAKDSGASAAEMILTALTRGAPRPVEWAPAREPLVALVGGTNLFAYTDVLRALVATDIDADLGRELARLNPVLLLDHLGARNPMTPHAAHEFLVHVSGQDLGRDTTAWERWLASPIDPENGARGAPIESQSLTRGLQIR